MAKINISEAAKLAGVSRSHLYKHYINTGKISVISEKEGKEGKFIDTAEIMRVFGELKPNTDKDAKDILLAEKDKIISMLQNEIEHFKSELAQANEREKWLREQIQNMPKQIEHKPNKGLLAWIKDIF